MVPGCGVSCKVTNIEALLCSRSETVEETNVRNAALVSLEEKAEPLRQPALIINEQIAGEFMWAGKWKLVFLASIWLLERGVLFSGLARYAL